MRTDDLQNIQLQGFTQGRSSLALGFKLLLTTLMILGLSHCQKARKSEFSQGQGKHLIPLGATKQELSLTGDFNAGPKVGVLKTSDVVLAKGITSEANVIEIVEGFDMVNNKDQMDFSVVAIDSPFSPYVELIQPSNDLKFYGSPETEYDLHAKATNENLIIFKVGERKDFPSNEMTSAESLGGGRYAVPMLGFPLSLVKVEKIEDSSGKDTRKYAEYLVETLPEATHIRVDGDRVTYFDAPSKLDLILADYIKEGDEFYYTRTLVGRPIDSRSRTGWQLSGLRLKFTRTKNSLLGVDLNIDKEEEVLDAEKTRIAIEIPVKWVDYRTVKTGSSTFLKEVEVADGDQGERIWSARKYGLLDLTNADRLQATPTRDNKLEKLIIGKDYIGFTIFESSTGYTFNYSLARASEPIVGTKEYLSDRKYFGIFKEVRDVIRGALTTEIEDIEDLHYQSKYYPKDGQIVFNITKDTPDTPEINKAIKDAVHAWDVGFQKAGTGIRILLDDERVDPGDVRYNKITFHGYEIDVGGLLGYGPNVGDQRTGEVYTSTTNMYLRGYREIIMRDIRKYIRYRLGMYDGKELVGVPSIQEAEANFLNRLQASPNMPILNLDQGGTSFVAYAGEESGEASDFSNFDWVPLSDDYLMHASQAAEVFNYESHMTSLRSSGSLALAPAYRKLFEPRYKSISELLGSSASRTHSKFEENPKHGQSMFTESLGLTPVDQRFTCEAGAHIASNSMSFAQIEATCMDNQSDFSNYLEELIELNDRNDLDKLILKIEGKNEAIYSCAEKLMPEMLFSVLMHELGHNFGLTHNFAASADKENYPKDADGNIIGYYSSVMDYTHRFDLYKEVGPYDIAAIRYFYAGKVEVADNRDELVEIDPELGIEGTFAKEGKQPYQYKNCIDMLAENGSLSMFDPQCRRQDFGSNPVETVDWAITNIAGLYTTNGFKYNNIRNPNLGATARYFIQMKHIYERFRLLLTRRSAQIGLYFDRINPDNFDQELAAVVADANNEELTSYYEATRKIFDFLLELMVRPDNFCYIQLGPQAREMDFGSLRQTIYRITDETVNSCEEAAAALNTTLISEWGNSIYPIEEFFDFEDIAEDFYAKIDFAVGLDPTVPVITSGTIDLKQFAQIIMFSRVPLTFELLRRGFTPNFMDEAGFRREMIHQLNKRLYWGIDRRQSPDSPPQLMNPNNPFKFDFVSDGALTSRMYNALASSVNSPADGEQRRMLKTNAPIRNANFQDIMEHVSLNPNVESLYYFPPVSSAGNMYGLRNIDAYSLPTEQIAFQQSTDVIPPQFANPFFDPSKRLVIYTMMREYISFEQGLRMLSLLARANDAFTSAAPLADVAPTDSPIVAQFTGDVDAATGTPILTTLISQLANLYKSVSDICGELASDSLTEFGCDEANAEVNAFTSANDEFVLYIVQKFYGNQFYIQGYQIRPINQIILNTLGAADLSGENSAQAVAEQITQTFFTYLTSVQGSMEDGDGNPETTVVPLPGSLRYYVMQWLQDGQNAQAARNVYMSLILQ